MLTVLGLLAAGLALPAVVLGGGTPTLARPYTDIAPYTAPTVTLVKPGSTPHAGSGSTTKSAPLASLFHTWGTWVPGGTWDGADYRWTSTGAQGKAITIRADHTWSWHGLQGTWRPTGSAEYPLLVVHGVSGHNWKVGAYHLAVCGTAGQLVISDGFTYYCGKREG